jgi:SulP family sulfate permease
MLLPKLFTTLRTYSRDQFVADLTAGLIVGVVALPLRSPLPSPAASRPTVGCTPP